MVNNEIKFRWPVGRINQAAFLVCVVSALLHAYFLASQVLTDYRPGISSHSGMNAGTFIDSLSLLGLFLLIALAIAKRYWLLSAAGILLFCSLLMRQFDMAFGIEWQTVIGITAIALEVVAYSLASIGLLMDERVSDVGLESEKR